MADVRTNLDYISNLKTMCSNMTAQMYERFGVVFSFEDSTQVLTIKRYGRTLNEFDFSNAARLENTHWQAVSYITKLHANIKERKPPKRWTKER